MPATNFGWLIDHQPIFQVYGTKRKNTSVADSQETMYEMAAKRKCTNQQCMDDDDTMATMATNQQPITEQAYVSGPHPQHACISQSSRQHSTTQNLDQIHHQHQVISDNRVPPLPDPTGDHGNNNNNNDIAHMPAIIENNNNHISQNYSQNEMIMDLNDEVFSNTVLNLNPTTDAEYEAACNMVAAMEDEGAPNPQQYRQQAYCDQYCSGGDTSPSSGRIRCPCRLSWEGMVDARPYISDYY